MGIAVFGVVFVGLMFIIRGLFAAIGIKESKEV